MTYDELDKLRIRYKNKIIRVVKPAAIIFAAIFVFVLITAGPAVIALLPAAFFVAIIILVVVIFSTRKEASAYKQAYKQYFVQSSLEKAFTDVVYRPDAGLPLDVIQNSGMDLGDRRRSEDLVVGKYKDIGFSQADLHIEEEHTDSDGDTTWTTVFRGRWMIFDFPKKFAFRLQVVQKWFGGVRASKNSEKIKTESSEFNKKFTVWAQDGFEAFYILDPAFMENITRVSEECNGKVFFCFVDNKLHVGLYNNKDSFEAPSCFKEIDEAAEMEKVSKDIKTITMFVDSLKLDKKLFK